jgi:lambda repressor-like predicted transcriptional regulator
MREQKSELLDEVNQLIQQYRQEVPGHRKAWPKSIRERVDELRKLGMTLSEIAKETGISYYTIFSWFERSAAKFEPVNIVPAKTISTVTVAGTKEKRRVSRPIAADCADKQSLATVTITLATGVRIEGLNFEALKNLLPALSGGGR